MKLDLKELIAKVVKRLNFSIVEVSSASTSVAGNGTAWISVTAPPNAVAMVGWYVNGSGLYFNVYCASTTIPFGNGNFAVRNLSTSTLTTTILAQFLVVGG